MTNLDEMLDEIDLYGWTKNEILDGIFAASLIIGNAIWSAVARLTQTERNQTKRPAARRSSRHLERQKLRLPCTVFDEAQVGKLDVVEVYAGETRLDEGPQRPEQMCRLDTQTDRHTRLQ